MVGDIHPNPGPGTTSAKVKDNVEATYPCTVCSFDIGEDDKGVRVTVGPILSVVISVILNNDHLHNLIVKFGCAHHVPPPVLVMQLMIPHHYHIHYRLKRTDVNDHIRNIRFCLGFECTECG